MKEIDSLERKEMQTLFGNLVDIAIERLKTFEPEIGYYLAFSGGKDSIVIKQLAIEAKVKFDAHYNLTTIDPPELVRYIKQYHTDVIIEKPEKSFFAMIPEKGFPMRQSRWCCELYKERGGADRMVLTGIRWEESHKRSQRKMVEVCKKDKIKRFLHAIIDWTEKDVWDFIKERNLPYCKLYDITGWKRIGCLCCPLARSSQRYLELARYPKYGAAFVRAFQKLKDRRTTEGSKSCDRWKDGKEMFAWWLTDKPAPNEEDDCSLFT